MRLLTLILFFQVLLLKTIIANQPDLRFKNITVEDGLSQSFVQCIFQDHYGFMWFGTDDGLNRYDGYDFIQYKYSTRDSNSISHSSISSIYEDNGGNLWIGTYNGLNLYNRSQNTFVRDAIWPQVTVRSIDEDNNSNLWIATVDNLFQYNYKLRKVTEYKPQNDSTGNGIFDIGKISSGYLTKVLIDSKNNIWIGSNRGLNLFKEESESFINIYHKENSPNSLGDNMINAIYEDHLGRIWIGHSLGLDLLVKADVESGIFQFRHFNNKRTDSHSISNGAVYAIAEDQEKRLWVGLDNGGINLMLLNNSDDFSPMFYHYTANANVPGSISANSVFSLYIDNQKNVWAGTYGKGVNLYTPSSANFKIFRNDPLNNQSISNNQVNVFYEDKDIIWIGTEGGLNRFEKDKNFFKCYSHNPEDYQSIGSNAVWSIIKDKKEDIWVGTWAGGLNKFNPVTGKFVRFTNRSADTNSIGSNNIFSIIEDSDGNIWLGTMGGGLNMYDREANQFIRYNTNNSKIYSDYVESIIEDKNGDLWMANLFTVERFNRKTRQFKQYMHNSVDSSSISGSKIYVLFKDSKSTIWIGTDVGLNYYVESTDGFISYQIQDGLPDNSIKSIVEDGHGNLWLGTNKGLSKFIDAIYHPEKPVFKNYSREDGLQSNEFNRRSCLYSKDGILYFGGENGFNIFDPLKLKENANPPAVVLTDFLLFNESVKIGKEDSPLKNDISLTKSITLKYNQSVFTIRFVAINYNIPSKNKYAYMLEGFDDKWNNVGNKRDATYTNLEPGSYIFRVKACNNDGVWTKEGTELEIIILPPWWQTIWFRILAILIIISLLVGFYFYKVNELKNQKIYLQEQVLERTKEIDEKNKALMKQAIELSETNALLEEKNQFIEEQNEILMNQTQKLNDSNALLEERQQLIEGQAEELLATADALKEKNSTLETLNATKDKFFAIIAHDLKNPFNAILGFSELLSMNYAKYTDEKRRNLIETIFDSSKRIYQLLENLLQWARTQTGSVEFKPVIFSLDELIDVNFTLIGNIAKEKDLILERIGNKEVVVYADKNMINTVIRNLLTNAVKFTDVGKITVHYEQVNNIVKVKIIDTGVGINHEKIKDIFNITGSKSTEGTRGESGTGLGLILCREFIEKNNGNIEVESEVGIGSSFIFTLPSKTI